MPAGPTRNSRPRISRVQADRRTRDRADRLPRGLRLPRLQVRPEADDQGRRRTTGRTTTSACSRGRRSSGARSARPGFRLPLHRVDTRAPDRGRPHAARVGEQELSRRASSTGTSSTIRSSARWSSAAGTSSTTGSNVPFDRLEDEVAPHSEWALFHLLVSPLLELRSSTSRSWGRRRGSCASSCRTPAGCRRT